MGKIIFNGDLKSRSEVKVDIEDRGYQFGDGVYEVIRVYNGELFAGDMHLNRLMDSAKLIQMKVPYTVAEIKARMKELITEDQLKDGIVYMQLTRGASPRTHSFPTTEVEPVFVAYTKEIPYTGKMKPGVKAVTTDDIRWLRCNIKSLNLLGNIMAKQQAVEAGCDEAIQHRDGTVTEGSSSNVSIVVDGLLKTHPATNLILNGITRQVMLKLCTDHGIPYVEEAFTVEDMMAADEVLYTSTSVEVTPIINIDGHSIAAGEPGPITQRLQKLFSEEIEKQCGSLK
ncbi:D-amino-acid transaminase [Peribacillus sp. NJ4]|uniref:D-amino-acid transaminase n=1 Tax=Peribacillus TaxID=2675229 RepID=UPI0025A23B89|nr:MULTISPECIES: D-amino-acid transaminase [unclassified Peribacillus]MDM5211273.1 D-amino-acid transaminase [Peribacillus sp. NJ4]MDM5221584.1 D-amino-acid transaminase [Peribacillus sp. NJ11]